MSPRARLAALAVVAALIALAALPRSPAPEPEVAASTEPLQPQQRRPDKRSKPRPPPEPGEPPSIAYAVADAVAPHMDNGFIRCNLPIRVPDSFLALRLPTWEGTTVTGFVLEPDGAKLVYHHTPSPVEGARPVRDPVALMRWWGAVQGAEGTCVVEPLEAITVSGFLHDVDGPVADEALVVCDVPTSTDAQGHFAVDTWRGAFCTIDARGMDYHAIDGGPSSRPASWCRSG